MLTVIIDINDKAQFDNASDRSREAGSKGKLSADLGFGGLGVDAQAGKGSASLDGSAETHSKGQGTIDRSEKLHLTVAAVVAEVQPDGNLLVSGSQEVRQYEVRVLNVTASSERSTSPPTTPLPTTRSPGPVPTATAAASAVQQPAWGQRASTRCPSRRERRGGAMLDSEESRAADRRGCGPRADDDKPAPKAPRRGKAEGKKDKPVEKPPGREKDATRGRSEARKPRQKRQV